MNYYHIKYNISNLDAVVETEMSQEDITKQIEHDLAIDYGEGNYELIEVRFATEQEKEEFLFAALDQKGQTIN